jgi:hypothetical protein
MNQLTIEVIKRPCALVLHIREPMDTVRRLAMFFEERHITVNTLNMHRYKSGDATLIVHCHIEKDRIPRTVQLLEQMPGITELERMEGR